jgi:electron transfer flavoprotein alpha subunit
MARKVVAIATDDLTAQTLVGLARSLDAVVTAVAVGPKEVAEAAAAAGPDKVLWAATSDEQPAEAWEAVVGDAIAGEQPDLLIAGRPPGAMALLGVAAVKVGAGIVPSVLKIEDKGGCIALVSECFNGQIFETFESVGPVAAQYTGEAPEVEAAARVAPIEELSGALADIKLAASQPTGAGGGVRTAVRVVGVGRGIKARADLEMVNELAQVLGAEVGCTLPIADDLHWMDEYLGRSGVTISPQLYLALGIRGEPQHMDGVRDSKVIVAVNKDPEAEIFRKASYGLVADVYELVPALIKALT